MGLRQIYAFFQLHPLTKESPAGALFRFAAWQIKSRLFRQPHKVRFVNNTQLWAKNGWTGVTGNIYTGLHEFEDMAFLLHLLRPGDLFVDVGANMGSYTVLASGACDARTMAFEPVQTAFKRLQENVALNNLNNQVECIMAAVGDEEGTIRITTNQDTTNHVTTQSEVDSSEVTLVKLDSQLSTCPVLIKIDTEGYELPVLKGAVQTLKNTSLKALIVEMNGSGERYNASDHAIMSLMEQHGFRPFQYNPFTRTLSEKTEAGSFNTLFCRDVEWIQSRLTQATPFTVLNRSI